LATAAEQPRGAEKLLLPSAGNRIDARSRFIGAWNAMQEGIGSSHTLEEQRQSLLDEMAKENADADLMQKMLREGL